MTKRTIDFEAWTPEEIAQLITEHAADASESVKHLWHAHIRTTPACSFETWNTTPGNYMYDQVTTALRTNAQMYLNALFRAKDLGHASELLDRARLSTAALLHYELIVRLHPAAANIEFAKKEGPTLGGHLPFLNCAADDPITGVRAYVDALGLHYSRPQ